LVGSAGVDVLLAEGSADCGLVRVTPGAFGACVLWFVVLGDAAALLIGEAFVCSGVVAGDGVVADGVAAADGAVDACCACAAVVATMRLRVAKRPAANQADLRCALMA
jgi:hypothetical protein